MQDYSFDQVIPRRHTNSYKWDTPQEEGVLPMWVADMDFKTAPCIIEALMERVKHGIFGYTRVPTEYYDAVVNWFDRRHGWTITPGHIIYTSGVVPAISAIIKGLTAPGDKVIVQTPAYNCFFSSIRNNGCELLSNELVYNADGRYSIDYNDLSKKAHDARLMILCNPHNPAGRVWTRDELTRIAEICRDNDVIVISDEIHCELTYPGFKYTPFATIAEAVGVGYVIANSPSKAFNTAGLQIANIISPHEWMRARIDRAINDNEVCDVNPFGVVGLIAAYNHGEGWLDALNNYLYQNYLYAKAYFERELPDFIVTPLEGTYLMWINCSITGLKSEVICSHLESEGHVMLSPGEIYGHGGEDFIRLNLACPRVVLHEGLTRIKQVLSIL
ncbi:MAG: pyridoxal phosphate-dependent aminotransferase [Muribaculaceae bacterium]|nr:pyridoxal phosphate-dependent aminotransferase [Muribaculaceae bacterium]